MKRYLIKVVNRATDNNENFKGVTSVSLFGKDQKMIGDYESKGEEFRTIIEPTKWSIEEHGYSRMCDAVRSWIWKNYMDDENFWTTEKEIVEVTI